MTDELLSLSAISLGLSDQASSALSQTVAFEPSSWHGRAVGVSEDLFSC